MPKTPSEDKKKKEAEEKKKKEEEKKKAAAKKPDAAADKKKKEEAEKKKKEEERKRKEEEERKKKEEEERANEVQGLLLRSPGRLQDPRRGGIQRVRGGGDQHRSPSQTQEEVITLSTLLYTFHSLHACVFLACHAHPHCIPRLHPLAVHRPFTPVKDTRLRNTTLLRKLEKVVYVGSRNFLPPIVTVSVSKGLF